MYLVCGAKVAQSVYDLTTDLTIGVQSLVDAKDFSSSLCVQTSSEANPASYPMVTAGPFPGGLSVARVLLTTHPHLVPMSRMSRSYTSSPLSACMASSGTALLSLYFNV
jgi:hypothetical protein